MLERRLESVESELGMLVTGLGRDFAHNDSNQRAGATENHDSFLNALHAFHHAVSMVDG